MAISSSLYASISGLSTMGEAMSVLGDNVANVNTMAFKSSRSTFQDVLSQSVSTAAGGAQVGRGVTLSTINSLFAQGSFESSSSPTDMAIGGQGFFMLRAGDSTEADMYSRAGEFGFDQSGNLVNPMGYFVQGWTLDSRTGERQGTIGDISIGKNTPPVATTQVDVVANLDSRKINESTEDRLFSNWNATNLAASNPTDPIDSSKYDYTTAVKVYDSKGASHDITVYYDRTTSDNKWEFLATCDPMEDLRSLTPEQQAIYVPDTRYNYRTQAGAGALLYGTIQFDTSGNITQIDAFNVPPDGIVDPSSSKNRILLEPGTSYFSLPTNFTGASTNDPLKINLGGRYDGVSTALNQVLVSDGGARVLSVGGDNSQYATSATLWSQVADVNGFAMTAGDTFTFAGYNNGSDPVSFTYTVDLTKNVQDFMTKLGAAFGATASIDQQGRLKLTDSTAGDSSLLVTSFATTTGTGAVPFGGTPSVTVPGTSYGQINVTTPKQMLVSSGRAFSTNTGATTPITGATAWSSVFADSLGNPGVDPLDTFSVTGTDRNGDTVSISYTVPALYTNPDGSVATVQNFLDTLSTAFNCTASIDAAGRLVLTDSKADTVGSASLMIIDPIVYTGSGTEAFGSGDFEVIPADIGSEDGSRQGDVVTTKFSPEALSTTQYANSSTTIFQDQDGFASGFLQAVSTDVDGVITGHYSNGQVLAKAQVALANFSNLAGLSKRGGNVFTETTDSGAPVTGAPGSNGLGSIAPNALEQSNVDLGIEFVKLITVQRGFQANSKIITTTDDMLNELINIKR